ncbi:hypothetical protein Syun_020683 [Stephania yunnanensis]|uniref:Uncharacterized protein n=1 Tax=Stephania yunnanensis TaxID=152371 RepID=A0AAP0IED3_9MAGN
MTISHVRSTLRASTDTTHLWNLAFLLPRSFCGVGGLKSDWRLGCLPPVGDPGVLTPASSTSRSHSTKDEGGLISLSCSLSLLPPASSTSSSLLSNLPAVS